MPSFFYAQMPGDTSHSGMQEEDLVSIDDEGLGLQSSLADLQRSLDLETFWQASLEVLSHLLPHSSCSLMLDIVDYHPRAAKHNVVETHDVNYVPATSLEVSKPFLTVHPLIKVYTYSQIVSEDPTASERRLAQEPEPGEWAEFVHLAFWDQQRPAAVLSVRRGLDQPRFSEAELKAMYWLYPMIAGGLQRLCAVETERTQWRGMQDFLHRSPVAVMLLDADGELLFGTPEAFNMCAHWKQGASKGDARVAETGMLPRDIARLLRQAVSQSESTGTATRGCTKGWYLRHAAIPGLSASIHLSQSVPGLAARNCYLLSFAFGSGATRSAAASSALVRLTPSERKVALLVAEGLRNDQVARQLYRSRRTIEFQLNSIYRKLDVACRSQLVKVLS
jgi:DNA-binding CsgD family transcriptional regulator